MLEASIGEAEASGGGVFKSWIAKLLNL